MPGRQIFKLNYKRIMNLYSKMKRPGATMAGIFTLALGSAVLLCGAGSVPVENFAPQGAMQSDLNAGGHNITNIATVSATNLIVSGTLTAPVAVSGLAGAGTGVTAAMAKAVNAPSGLAVQGMNGDILMNVQLTKVNSASTTVLLVGDSTTEGAGVTDVRQGPAPILSTLGFCINGSSVVRWGWSAYTTYSINAINATSNNINVWTGGTQATSLVTTSPATLAAPYVIIDAGTNDYFGVYLSTTLSTSSATVTVSRNYYFADGAGHQRAIAAGDKVAVYSGSGVLAANTTVVSTTSTTITLSANPTTSGSVLLKVEPTPTTSTYHTDLANLISNAHAANAGAKVFVATLRPANNTTTPADGVATQGDFQDNVPIYNTYIRGLTIGGGGANPDGLIDEAAMPEFSSFNAAYYYTDQLHPNFAGNQAIARAENAALISVVPASNLVMQAGSESTPDSSLSNNVPLLNQTNTYTSSAQYTTPTFTGNAYTYINGNTVVLHGSTLAGSGTTTIELINAVNSQPSQLQFAQASGTITGSISTDNSGGQTLYINSGTGGVYMGANAGLNVQGPIFALGGITNGKTGAGYGIFTMPYTTQFGANSYIDLPDSYATNNFSWRYFNTTSSDHTQIIDKKANVVVMDIGPTATGTVTVSGTVAAPVITATGMLVSAGPINSTSTLTTVNGSTAGTATFTEPFQGASYKKVIVQLGSTLSGTASFTFPTAFTSTPLVVNADPAVTALSATAVTVTGTLTLPRTVVLEGF